MATLEESAKKLDVRTMMISSIVTALAFVVGLFWNDAIRSTIEQIIPKPESLFYKYAAAIAVTIVVVIVAYLLYRSQELKIRHMEEMLEGQRKHTNRIINKIRNNRDNKKIAKK